MGRYDTSSRSYTCRPATNVNAAFDILLRPSRGQLALKRLQLQQQSNNNHVDRRRKFKRTLLHFSTNMVHHTVVTRAEHEAYMKSTFKLCPFCGFTNSISHMVHIHVGRHFEAAVKYKDFLIVKCSGKCRERAHFHCCFCEKTVINRSQLLTHISMHPEPRDVGEPGVTTSLTPATTSDMDNVMNKDITVGLSNQQEHSFYNSGAERFGAESCVQETPSLEGADLAE
nr:uncharacterized protein LOC129431638 [Misgurnus anguillicaudatus]